MSWYRFGTYYKRSAVGARGPPGVGFKLTKDGNYDMENKILKNCHPPIEDRDVATKSYLEAELLRTSEEIRDTVENVKAGLRGEITTNAEEINAKIKTTVEESDSKYLSFRDRKPIDAKGKRIGNVADPTEDRNVVNRRYLENYVSSKVSYATSVLGSITYKPNNNAAHAVIFTKFSGDILNSECKFTRKGFFRLGLFLDPSKVFDEFIEVSLYINNTRYSYKMKVLSEFMWFGEVSKDDHLKIFLKSTSEFTVQPFLKLEEIKWTLELR